MHRARVHSPGRLAVFALDTRLAALAATLDATYTRYADDLAFSGGRELERRLGWFIPLVGAIAIDEGFRLQFRKTRVMRAGARQRLCGLVVNRRPNVARSEYDQLRALLHNAAKHGPASQNRHGHADFRAHLTGRIAWIAESNPARAARLERAMSRIVW